MKNVWLGAGPPHCNLFFATRANVSFPIQTKNEETRVENRDRDMREIRNSNCEN